MVDCQCSFFHPLNLFIEVELVLEVFEFAAEDPLAAMIQAAENLCLVQIVFVLRNRDDRIPNHSESQTQLVLDTLLGVTHDLCLAHAQLEAIHIMMRGILFVVTNKLVSVANFVFVTSFVN